MPEKILLTKREMETLEDLLSIVLEDTFNCWINIRVKGHSASLYSDGNISLTLLQTFDRVRRISQ